LKSTDSRKELILSKLEQLKASLEELKKNL
jgi:hypothetical protein